MADTATTMQEHIVREGTIQTRFFGIWDQGRGVITPQRFYFEAHGEVWLKFFLGPLIIRAFPLRVRADIPLTSITAIGRGRLGLLRDVFFIETLEGKKYQYRFEYQFWLDALRDTIQRQTGATLSQTDKERWEVQR